MDKAPAVETFVDLTEGREIVVNRFLPGAFIGGLHLVLLGTSQAGVVDGKLVETSVIMARLRFNTEMAVMMRDMLTNAINAVTPPKDEKAH